MILALNTATPQFSLALMALDGTLLVEWVMGPGGKQFKDFMPALDFVMSRSNSKPNQLDAVMVTKGPGSFTGLRVGLSTAKGLSQALGIPLIGLSTLEALASQLPWTDREVCALIDSRKGEVFAGRFFWDNGRHTRRSEEVCLTFEDLTDFASDENLFIGNDFPSQHTVIREVLGTHARLAPASLWQIRASALGYAGLERFHRKAFDDPGSLTPVYMRPADVRPPHPHPLLNQRRTPLTSGGREI